MANQCKPAVQRCDASNDVDECEVAWHPACIKCLACREPHGHLLMNLMTFGLALNGCYHDDADSYDMSPRDFQTRIETLLPAMLKSVESYRTVHVSLHSGLWDAYALHRQQGKCRLSLTLAQQRVRFLRKVHDAVEFVRRLLRLHRGNRGAHFELSWRTIPTTTTAYAPLEVVRHVSEWGYEAACTERLYLFDWRKASCGAEHDLEVDGVHWKHYSRFWHLYNSAGRDGARRRVGDSARCLHQMHELPPDCPAAVAERLIRPPASR